MMMMCVCMLVFMFHSTQWTNALWFLLATVGSWFFILSREPLLHIFEWNVSICTQHKMKTCAQCTVHVAFLIWWGIFLLLVFVSFFFALPSLFWLVCPRHTISYLDMVNLNPTSNIKSGKMAWNLKTQKHKNLQLQFAQEIKQKPKILCGIRFTTTSLISVTSAPKIESVQSFHSQRISFHIDNHFFWCSLSSFQKLIHFLCVCASK